MSGFAHGRWVWLLLLAGSVLQQPGRTTWDTKLDLTSDPGAFLGRALHLWNPQASFGELQNQAYGYLFPQGPFFVLGEVVGLPDWVVQRLWSALLLVLAYEGTRMVARALGMPTLAGVAAGLVYACSPRLLGAVGVLTGEVLPSTLLPWAVLPLLLAARGRLTPRVAGLASGVAVLCMSGVNAVGTLATLPLAAAVVLAQVRRPHGRRLLAWWTLGVGAACAWWMVPLVLLGRYSPPFLDVIETSAATTATTGWANAVRGTDHWLSYYAIGEQAWWPGARLLATEPWLVVLTGAVAAVGLVGLAHPAMPWRRPLLAGALVGLLCLTAGNPATWGSLVDGPVRALLDGALAPLRNVHKVDPLVRLPLALGFAHALVVLVRRLPARSEQRLVRPVVVAAAAAALVAGATPLWSGDLRMPGYRQVPDAWAETAAFLAEDSVPPGGAGDAAPASRALVLPGTGFALQTWGWTIDEPLQGLARAPWASRSQVPLVPGPTARLLDLVERRVSSGEGSPALAALLARSGVGHVVLRRDVDPFVAETVPPERVELALVGSPGFTRVASFGSSGFGDQGLIDVYRVEGDEAAGVAPAVVDVVPRDAQVAALLDADGVLTALEAGVLPAAGAVVAPGPGAGGGAAADAPDTPDAVVTDAYRRVEREFGRVHDATSQVLAAEDPWRSDRSTKDFAGPEGLGRATADFTSGVVVTASSSEGYAEELGAVRPELGPAAALDGDLGTRWHSGTLRRPDRQWWQVDLTGAPGAGEALAGRVVAIRLQLGQPAARVSRLRVTFTTQDGSVTSVYGVPRDGVVLAPAPRSTVRTVRLSVVEAIGAEAELGRVMLREVELAGVEPGRSLALTRPLRGGASLALRLEPPRRPCVDLGYGPVCDLGDARPAEDAGRLDRTFEVGSAGEWELAGHVVAAPGAAASRLLEPLDGRVAARASSVLGGDPAVSAQFAVDGDPRTAWLTDPGVARASLGLRFGGGPRTITGIRVAGSGGAAQVPSTAVVSAGGERRVVPLAYLSEFEPLVARGGVRVLLRREGGPGSGPMGVGEVELEGLEELVAPPDLASPTGAVCGLGPPVLVDGVARDTEVTGTIDDVRRGRPMSWRVCDGPVRLAPGTHRVQSAATVQFQPTALGWRPVDASPGSTPDAATADRAFEVERWQEGERRVRVAAGDEAVLRVAENPNPGWEATLGGQELEPVLVDGWQQGWLVPAGEGGTIRLSYGPDGVYRVGLLGGGVLALLLVLVTLGLAVLDRRRTPRTDVAVPAPPPGVPGWITGGTGLALLVAGGPVAAGGLLAAWWPRLRAWSLPLGGALLATSGVISALSPTLVRGTPGLAADGAAAAGVGLLVGAALLRQDSSSAELPGRARAAWQRVRATLGGRSRLTLWVGLLLVAGQAALRAVVGAGSYFWQDDFLHLDLSRTLGLGSDYLVRDYSGHLEPGQYLLMWAIARVGEGSWLPAVVTLVLLQAVASVLLLLLLRQLFGSSPWVLVPFAAYLVTPLGLATATWLAAGLQAFPLQISMLGAALAAVRFLATGRRRWAVLSVLAHALGLACWQKAGVVLPFLLALEVLVLARGLPLRARARRVWTRRWFWLAHTALLTAYVAVYLALTGSGDLGAPADRSLLAPLHDMLGRTLVPGLFGLPWDPEGAGSTIYPDTPLVAQVAAALMLLALVVASVVRSGRAAWSGWLLVVGFLAADVALVLLGRGAYLLLVARDPRYVTDALPVIAIGVCAAFAAGRAERSGPPRRRVLPWVVVLAVLASGLVSTWRLAPVTQHPQSEAYVRTLTQALAREPGAEVLLTPVPTEVAVSVNAESLLRAVGREQRLDRPGAHPLLIAPDGGLVPARVAAPDLTAQGPTADCGWSLGERATSLTVLPPAEDPASRVLRLVHVAAEAGILVVEVDGQEQAVPHGAGLGEVVVVVGDAVGPLRASVRPVAEVAALGLPAGRFCLAEVQRGVAVPAG